MRALQIGGLMIGLIGGSVLSATVAIHMTSTASTSSAISQPIAPLIAGNYLVAAPGRVEPASEEYHPSSAVTGVLTDVPVKEGDYVKKGDVLARVEDTDYVAEVARTQALVQVREAELQRIVNGARAAERQGALAAVQEADAVEKNAKLEVERMRQLAAVSAATRSARDKAETAYVVAQERAQQALHRYDLVNDPARQEDVSIAEAQLATARATLAGAKAELAKTVIRSPIDGTVLRVFRHPGELLSIFSNDPILSLGDLSKLYVRAEIDEADVAKVQPGLPAYVTAEAYGDRHFGGRVLRVSPILGRKNIFSEQAGERTDRKILEVIVALDMPSSLPAGLRVNTFIGSPPDELARHIQE